MENRRFIWIHSIQFKQQVLLLVILAFFVGSCTFFYKEAVLNSKNSVYEKMESQATYYLDSLDDQMDRIVQQGANFYQDRKLSYIAYTGIGISNYEWRDAVLSVQDHLFSMESANALIQKVELYAPFGGYALTSSQAINFGDTQIHEFEKMCKYMEKAEGCCFYDGEGLYFYITQSVYSPDIIPTFILKVKLNEKVLMSNLTKFVSEEGGAFFYQDGENFIIKSEYKDEDAESAFETIKHHLTVNNLPEGITSIKAGEKAYLICCRESKYFGWMVQFEPENLVLNKLKGYSTWFILFVFTSIIFIFAFSIYTNHMVNRPLKRLLKAFYALEDGNIEIQLSSLAKDEFGYIYEEFNHMTHRLQGLIEEVAIQKNMTHKAELKQLQSQINPHFLYNSFFLLSSRIKRGDMEGAEEFSHFLGVYFKFITRNTSDTVLLVQEVEHSVAYAKIQGARFASRIQVDLEELPQNAEKLVVPRLILQPILENAFQHGLENIEENGILRMYYRETEEKFQIYVENNGAIVKKDLDKMQEMLKDNYDGEITGLINIHRRLRMFYKGKGGLTVSIGELGGICVMLEIPRENEEINQCIDY